LEGDSVEKVLIVDDSITIRKRLRTILEKNGYIVIGEAEDGNQAINMCLKYKPNIITMDIFMPDLSGIDTIKLISDIDKTTKIIVISSYCQKDILLSAINAGAIEVIIKPFDEETVIKVLDSI
jgi:two-component system chemotaxis response regulator CheY